MINKKLFWFLFLGIVGGFIILGVSFSKKILPPAQPIVEIPTPEPVPEAAPPLVLRSGDTMKLPMGWSAKALSGEPQFQNYVVTTANNEFPLSEITVREWLNGPSAEETDVIRHEKRPQALNVLQNLYDHGQISSTDRAHFFALAGEFLGYSDTYRSALTYITSADNTFRGISFYNLVGQDIGVSPVYYIALYNPTSETIVFANYYLTQSTPEIAATNAKLRTINWTKNNNDTLLAKLDLEAREQFKKLIEETPRKDLSFGASLDALDGFMQTASHTP